MKKIVIDVWNGYYLVFIREEDRYFIIFIILWGRYRYKVVL